MRGPLCRMGSNSKSGMTSSTDSHTHTTAQENNFFGKHTGTEPSQ